MAKLFNMDSPIMRFLGRMGDLMILNLLVTVCSLPIITAGASFTAMHYVLLKMVRGEEGYITKDFFKSFKMNFKQSTVIWLIKLLLFLFFFADYYIVVFSGVAFPEGLHGVLVAAAVIVFVVSTYIFPVLSRFENTIGHTIKNGCIMGIMAAPKAILIAVLEVMPVAVIFLTPRLFPLVLLFGYSFPGFLSAMLYSGTFKKFEPEPEPETSDEEFHLVFEDEKHE